MIIQNVKIVGEQQTLELDRNSTENLILESVFLGNQNLTTQSHTIADSPVNERGYWTKPLRNIIITGYAIEKQGVLFSLAENKIRLNRFVKPNQWFSLICDNGNPLDVLITSSVLYDKIYKTNNPAFCRFTINGIARQAE